MKNVIVTVEYMVEYDDDITEEAIDINDIIRDPDAIKNIELHIGKSHPVFDWSPKNWLGVLTN